MCKLISILITLLALGACTDDDHPLATLLPDAGVDCAPLDARVDATCEPSGDCCELLPEESAVTRCAVDGLAPDVCGVIVCRQTDCTLTRISFCTAPAPADAGVQ